VDTGIAVNTRYTVDPATMATGVAPPAQLVRAAGVVVPPSVSDTAVTRVLAVPRLLSWTNEAPAAGVAVWHVTAKAPAVVACTNAAFTAWTWAVLDEDPNKPNTKPPIATAAMRVTAMMSTVAMMGEIAFLFVLQNISMLSKAFFQLK
jgi:hypothetical protein